MIVHSIPKRFDAANIFLFGTNVKPKSFRCGKYFLTCGHRCGIRGGMTLAEFLDKKQITASQFALLIDVRPAAVSRWLSGDRLPKWRTLMKIELATSGAVKPNDFAKKASKTAVL